MSDISSHNFHSLFVKEKLEKLCPSYEIWDEIWGGRINVDPGFTFESASVCFSDRESSFGLLSSAGSASEDEANGDEERAIAFACESSKTSKKRGRWSKSSETIVNLGKVRNDIMRERIDRKYKYLDKKTETKKELARLEIEAETKKEMARISLEKERIKLERERMRFEAAKRKLSVDLPKLGESDNEEEE